MPGKSSAGLRRTLGLGALTFYGIGDILGAGIYAVTGKVAAHAGSWSALSFAVALFAAGLTALSYAELSRRFPSSGGESYFCQQAFRSNALALLVGWLVLCSGLVSMATACHAFRGSFTVLLPPAAAGVAYLLPFGFLIVLALLNLWGMRQSSTANIVCTFIEISGLLIVIAVAVGYLVSHEPPGDTGAAVPVGAAPAVGWTGVLRGSTIAFFAFIGFEDMVNVSEEVHEPERNLPRAILLALSGAGLLYLVVVILAVRVVPTETLSTSSAPLLEVVRHAAPGFPEWVFSLIASFAVANTALLNFIMGSRLLYGMARQGLVPSPLRSIWGATGTPYVAILSMLVAGLALVAAGELEALAGATSFLLLGVFTLVNLSLLATKRRNAGRDRGFRVPLPVPVAGGLVSLGLAIFVPPASLPFVAALLLLGGVAMGIHRWRSQSGARQATTSGDTRDSRRRNPRR
jgi:amino acid transporter